MPEANPRILVMDPADSVAVALVALAPGEAIAGLGVRPLEPIPAGHKIALAPVAAGAPVIKYGQIIGFASRDIAPGQHVHVHNVALHQFDRDYAIGSQLRPTDFLPEESRATFQGFARPDGQAGTRNYLGVIATVNCSATVARLIAQAVGPGELAKYPHVDGIVPLTHGTGCAMDPQGEGYQLLQRTLAGAARNPNFAGVLLVGLGCETNLVETLLQNTGLAESPRLGTLVIQDEGGTRKTVARGAALLRPMLAAADQLRRSPQPASQLVLGMECGGSDAYSGITANPCMGRAADLLIRHGGTAILSETPEIYGAEHLLTRRTGDPAVARKLIARIHWWEKYTALHGAQINNNPSPGNKAGGLTTILEKSLGAVAKAGSTDLKDVYLYGERVTSRGLVFMDTPGYDVVSLAGMIAGGANLACFTTGRGTVCGVKPAPTIKLASNRAMYQRLAEDMDLDCGRILAGETDLAGLGAELFALMLRVASGERTKSELQGFGELEFVPWPIGAVL